MEHRSLRLKARRMKARSGEASLESGIHDRWCRRRGEVSILAPLDMTRNGGEQRQSIGGGSASDAGFSERINASFLSRRQRLSCFSRSIAARAVSNRS